LNHHKIKLEKNKTENKEIKEKKTKNDVKAIVKPDNKQKNEKTKSNRKIQVINLQELLLYYFCIL